MSRALVRLLALAEHAQNSPVVLHLMGHVRTQMIDDIRLLARHVEQLEKMVAERDDIIRDAAERIDKVAAERDDADNYIRAIWRADLLPSPMGARLFDRLTATPCPDSEIIRPKEVTS